MKKEKSIDFKYNLKLYWEFLKKYKLMFFFLMILILIIESSYLFEAYVLKILFDYSGEFIAKTIGADFLRTIFFRVAIIFLLVGLTRAVLKFIHIHTINVMDSSIIKDVKYYFFKHLIFLSNKFHTTHKTGSMISRLVRSGSSVERMTDVFIFNFTPLFLKLIITIVVVSFFSKVAALLIFGIVLIFIIYNVSLQIFQEPYNVDANDAEDADKAAIGDYFTNIASIKNFGKEKHILKKFSCLIENSRKKMLIKWHIYRWMDFGQAIILSMGTILVIFVAFSGFANNDLSLGSLMFIINSYWGLIGLMFSFIHGTRNFYQAMADFEVLFQYNKIDNEVFEKPTAKNYKVKKGKVEFKDITFSYDKKRNVFSKFDLEVPSSKMVALVGHSGCGKSTLVKLLYRLYDVDSGEILIDGKNIKDYKKEQLRNEMSIVPQECALFDDTIYNNISFAKPSATKKEVIKAAKQAQLHKIIEDFPNGYETIVGERGVKLSGGEKQRVSIARALLANKKILVLDEATSALDSQTEHDIQKALARLMKGRTSIVIAHRLSTIMKADFIVVMNKGKIVEIDTHEQLVAKDGHYGKMWDLQKGGFE